MEIPNDIFEGKIQKRYKRFFADVTLDNGEEVTAHTPNTGSMKTCWEPGWKAIVSFKDDPKRKLKYTLEMTHNGESWIGVHTGHPNKLAKEAIENGVVKELQGYESIKPEYKVGKSRIDLLLYDGDLKEPTRKCFVEIKNVTLLGEKQVALFPDAVSERGQKHLRELTELVQEGHEAAMLYVIQREDVKSFSPAENIDPEYARLLRESAKAGVQVLAYQCHLTPKEIVLRKPLPVKL